MRRGLSEQLSVANCLFSVSCSGIIRRFDRSCLMKCQIFMEDMLS